MKQFSRVFAGWTLKGWGLLLVIAIVQIISETDYDSSRNLTVFLVVMIGGAFLGLCFTMLELYVIPHYSIRVKRKLDRLFCTRWVNNEMAEFERNGHRLYLLYYHKLEMAKVGSSDFLEIHIAQNEVEEEQLRRYFKIRESSIGGMSTYILVSSNSMGLKRMARKLEKWV